MMRKRRRWQGESLEPRWVLDSVVVFNELMYHPTDTDARGEWIELRNLLSTDVDLSGWSIHGGVDYSFAAGTTIPADGYLLVVADPSAWQGSSVAHVLGPFQGALANEGERVELRNNSSRIMDAVDYDDASPWPVGPDGQGASLAKHDANWTSRDPQNWESSRVADGTPGGENRPTIDLTPRITEVIPLNSAWQYDGSNVDRGAAWREPEFDASSWPQGSAPFARGQRADGPATLLITSLDPLGDADIQSTDTYTHLLDFGGQDNGALINGVKFTPITAANVLQTAGFTWSNSSGIRTVGRPTSATPLTGPLQAIFQDYLSNTLNNAEGTVRLLLQNLTPGTRYLTRVYSRRNDATSRNVTFDFQNGTEAQSVSLDQSNPPLADPAAPYALDFEFEAQATELEITVTQHDGTHPWLWYGLSNHIVSLSNATSLPPESPTQYFRQSFNYVEARNADHELTLRWLVDDGAVIYLNGQEIARANLPAGSVSFPTSANVDVSAVHLSDPLTLPASELRSGTNVVAVELHQAANGNTDAQFAAQLAVVERPRPLSAPPSIWFNELPAAESAERSLELFNASDDAVDLQQLELQLVSKAAKGIALPAGTLAAHGYLTISVPDAEGKLAVGNAMVLKRAADGLVIDAERLTTTRLARDWSNNGRWLIPVSSTPSAANVFDLTNDVVINEIMYHATPKYRDGDQAFAESPDEWIELYNRGSRNIPLGGWTLSGGVQFAFANDEQLAPHEYLVIVRDVREFQAKYPAVTRVVGGFAGTLSNQDDGIRLIDSRGNPADEVHYYQDGSWPSYADGGGSSLELRDPWSDNSRGDSWAASREDDQAAWMTVTYEGLGKPPSQSQDPIQWHELVLGLLDAGEIWLDDVSVIEDPAGTAIERMQNGGFEQGADHWRFVGNHGQHGQTQVIADPDVLGNHVLHVVATGATEHMSNHLETTLLDNVAISSSKTYRISFRARWLAGSPQVHSRLYFNRLAHTAILPQSTQPGTPGGVNSQSTSNAGPTLTQLQQDPVTPKALQPVTISARVADHDGVGNVRLWYSQNGDTFLSLPMQPGNGPVTAEGRRYSATIPGFAADTLVQFFVEASDSAGAKGYAPPAGNASRALYRVEGAPVSIGPRHSMKILMTDADLNEMYVRTNLTSSERHGATVIWQGDQVYYDVDVRFKGSGYSRGSAATGFNLSFPAEHLFLGEHDVISIDRQGGVWGIGASLREMTIKHIANRAGNIPMMYDDIIYLQGPRSSFNGSAQLLVARYDDVFFDSLYDNGSAGTRYKFELIYYPQQTANGNVEGLKLSPSTVLGVDMPYMGDDPNSYRWNYLIRNNRAADDYSRIIALTDALRLTGSTVGGALDVASQAVMDVDQWMRLFAFESLAGSNDTFNQGLPHNLQLYARPTDGRVMAMPWDMDYALHQPTNMGIYGTGSRLTRVINIPTNQRVFQQHLWDIMQSTYRRDYLEPWVRHLATRAQQDVTSEVLSYVDARRAFVLSRLRPQVPFEITNANKDDLQVDQPIVTLEGRGWIDVRNVYRTGDLRPLPIKWLDAERWQIVVPLETGRQTIELNAFDLQGNPVGSASATVTATGSDPWVHGLRVTELNYHPASASPQEVAAGVTDADEFEFVEVTNIGSSDLDLTGVHFDDLRPDGSREGISFAFAPQTILPSGQSMIVVKDVAAISARYGDQLPVAGTFDGQLSNNGESLRLIGPAGQLIQEFTYLDDWYADTDGQGATLEVRSPWTASANGWSDPATWRASGRSHGSPGRTSNSDFNGDGLLSVADIDLICAAIESPTPRFDLNEDTHVDLDDLAVLVAINMHRSIGDVTDDGRFSTEDIVSVFQRGEYEDAFLHNSTWLDGDWNCDRDFSSEDFVFALQQGGWEG